MVRIGIVGVGFMGMNGHLFLHAVRKSLRAVPGGSYSDSQTVTPDCQWLAARRRPSGLKMSRALYA